MDNTEFNSIKPSWNCKPLIRTPYNFLNSHLTRTQFWYWCVFLNSAEFKKSELFWNFLFKNKRIWLQQVVPVLTGNLRLQQSWVETVKVCGLSNTTLKQVHQAIMHNLCGINDISHDKAIYNVSCCNEHLSTESMSVLLTAGLPLSQAVTTFY